MKNTAVETPRYFFIFEGSHGAGKSTAIPEFVKLIEAFRSCPTATEVLKHEAPRADSGEISRLYQFAAQRDAMLEDLFIRGFLETERTYSEWIVADRWTTSNAERVNAASFTPAFVRSCAVTGDEEHRDMQFFAAGNFIPIVFVLTADAATLVERSNGRRPAKLVARIDEMQKFHKAAAERGYYGAWCYPYMTELRSQYGMKCVKEIRTNGKSPKQVARSCFNYFAKFHKAVSP